MVAWGAAFLGVDVALFDLPVICIGVVSLYNTDDLTDEWLTLRSFTKLSSAILLNFVTLSL